MSEIKCPECGSKNILTERRLDGFHACLECLHHWKIVASQPKPSLFDRITASPEVLAPKFVYEYTLNPPASDGTTKLFHSLLTGKNYYTEAEAITATVARLKEVAE